MNLRGRGRGPCPAELPTSSPRCCPPSPLQHGKTHSKISRKSAMSKMSRVLGIGLGNMGAPLIGRVARLFPTSVWDVDHVSLRDALKRRSRMSFDSLAGVSRCAYQRVGIDGMSRRAFGCSESCGRDHHMPAELRRSRRDEGENRWLLAPWYHLDRHDLGQRRSSCRACARALQRLRRSLP